MQLKNVFAAVFIALSVAVAMSGCVSNTAPTPTPAPSPAAATPVPQQQWPPATIGTIKSEQVCILDPQKNVNVSYIRNMNATQTENFSVLLTNIGGEWANNTFITVRVTDAQTAQYYFSQEYNVGNISPHQSQWVNVTTATHEAGFSVLVQLTWYWGDNLELYNTYQRAYTLLPVNTDELYY